jgi:hypothetical protein
MQPANPPLRVLARRALSADGDHGWEHGTVVQADELRWKEPDALADLTAPTVDIADTGAWHLASAGRTGYREALAELLIDSQPASSPTH